MFIYKNMKISGQKLVQHGSSADNSSMTIKYNVTQNESTQNVFIYIVFDVSDSNTRTGINTLCREITDNNLESGTKIVRLIEKDINKIRDTIPNYYQSEGFDNNLPRPTVPVYADFQIINSPGNIDEINEQVEKLSENFHTAFYIVYEIGSSDAVFTLSTSVNKFINPHIYGALEAKEVSLSHHSGGQIMDFSIKTVKELKEMIERKIKRSTKKQLIAVLNQL